MDDRFLAVIESLALAVEERGQVTHDHLRRVQRHARALADAFGMTDVLELKAMDAASLLHDVGKITVSDRILNKPGCLTAEEYAEMKLHVESGVRILERVHFPYPVVPIVKHHHEAWNGAGYPNGVSGTRIPLGARILSVVDVFDALTSDRPYRRRHTDAAALAMLHADRGKQFQPEVVDQFIALVPALRRMDAEHAVLTAGHRPPGAAPRVERCGPCTHQRPTTVWRENAPRVLRQLQELTPQAEAPPSPPSSNALHSGSVRLRVAPKTFHRVSLEALRLGGSRSPLCHHDLGWNTECDYPRVALHLPFRSRQERQQIGRATATHQRRSHRSNPADDAGNDPRSKTTPLGKTRQAEQRVRAKHSMSSPQYDPDIVIGKQIEDVRRHEAIVRLGAFINRWGTVSKDHFRTRRV